MNALMGYRMVWASEGFAAGLAAMFLARFFSG